MSQIKLSIITPCQNSGSALAKCVKSVAMQIQHGVEHIVVDACTWIVRVSLPYYWYLKFPIHLVQLGDHHVRWLERDLGFLWHDCDDRHPGIVRFLLEWRELGRDVCRIHGTSLAFWRKL